MWKKILQELAARAGVTSTAEPTVESPDAPRRVAPEGPTWEAEFAAQDAAIMERIRRLPPSVGVTLLTAGAVGAVLPGSVGTPLLIAGGMVLAPRLFEKVDGVVRHKFPGLHHHGLQALGRFLDDFERRYPPESENVDENPSPSDTVSNNAQAEDLASDTVSASRSSTSAHSATAEAEATKCEEPFA